MDSTLDTIIAARRLLFADKGDFGQHNKAINEWMDISHPNKDLILDAMWAAKARDVADVMHDLRHHRAN